VVLCDVSLKPYEQWWEKNVDSLMSEFAQWLGDTSDPSRLKARRHIQVRNYRSILDIPCGLATDFYGFRRDAVDIEYMGMDITPKLIKFAQDNNVPVRQGNIEAIACEDSSFDVCYARHILEHLAYYESAVAELIRVAKKEVLIVFFIKPTEASDTYTLNFDRDCLLYANHYNRQKLQNFVLSNAKVASIEWEDVDAKDIILHVYLK
jgi:ubiquinone/menaquinone biosynthesis C-methylase UbiE